MKNNLISLIILFSFAACNNNGEKADAYGNFEAVETIISSESVGTIQNSFIEEGDVLKEGDTVFIIDGTSLLLQKQTLLNQKNAAASGFSNILAQVEVLNKQKDVLNKEKQRVLNLLKDSAATLKQLDDITGQLDVLDQKIRQVKTQNQRIFDELKVFDAQLKSVDDLLQKTVVINPVSGTVLVKYSEVHELAILGKALYKIADTENIILRAYVSGIQLDDIKTGQAVKVFIDKNKDENHEYPGIITWISSKAEFTPKIIQTKEERVNLVYAIKIKVKNDGKIKIGMPGEVMFN
jgi:HlyD family secretion protein